MKTEQFCIRCGMSNLEINGYNNCNVYRNNYGKHDFEPMNKLHDALKNEELMLEVGRKATEEQKAMTQSTVEERLKNEFLVTFPDKNDWNYASWSSGDNNVVIDGTYDIKDLFDRIEVIIKSEIKLAEQKAREDERERIGRTCMNIDGLKYEDGMLWVGIKSDSIDSVENFNIIPHKSLSTK